MFLSRSEKGKRNLRTRRIEMKAKRILKAGGALAATCMVAAALAAPVAAQDAKEIYTKNCQVCHGPAGHGDGPVGKMMKPPPGDFGTTLKGTSDADIAKLIKEGGKAVGKSASMPAYGTKLSDDQITALVAYVKGFGAK
jgi:cytochrome c oxidase cbb3-type subunit III